MSASVLMVCEGNICRSPMAAALLTKALSGDGGGGVGVGVGIGVDHPLAAPACCSRLTVHSAGTRARHGCRSDDLATALMAERGVDLRAHSSRALSAAQVSDAQLILTMTRAQRTLIEARYPSARGKVYRLGEHDRLDVVDPYRRGRFIFELAVAQIEQGVSRWLSAIASLQH